MVSNIKIIFGIKLKHKCLYKKSQYNISNKNEAITAQSHENNTNSNQNTDDIHFKNEHLTKFNHIKIAQVAQTVRIMNFYGASSWNSLRQDDDDDDLHSSFRLQNFSSIEMKLNHF